MVRPAADRANTKGAEPASETARSRRPRSIRITTTASPTPCRSAWVRCPSSRPERRGGRKPPSATPAQCAGPCPTSAPDAIGDADGAGAARPQPARAAHPPRPGGARRRCGAGRHGRAGGRWAGRPTQRDGRRRVQTGRRRSSTPRSSATTGRSTVPVRRGAGAGTVHGRRARATSVRWVLPSDVATGDIPCGARFAPFPSPLLVQIGGADAGELFVDLEATGLLAVDGEGGDEVAPGRLGGHLGVAVRRRGVGDLGRRCGRRPVGRHRRSDRPCGRRGRRRRSRRRHDRTGARGAPTRRHDLRPAVAGGQGNVGSRRCCCSTPADSTTAFLSELLAIAEPPGRGLGVLAIGRIAARPGRCGSGRVVGGSNRSASTWSPSACAGGRRGARRARALRRCRPGREPPARRGGAG